MCVAVIATFAGMWIHRIETDATVTIGGDIVGGVVHIVNDVHDDMHGRDDVRHVTDDADGVLNVGVEILVGGWKQPVINNKNLSSSLNDEYIGELL